MQYKAKLLRNGKCILLLSFSLCYFERTEEWEESEGNPCVVPRQKEKKVSEAVFDSFKLSLNDNTTISVNWAEILSKSTVLGSKDEGSLSATSPYIT